MTTIILTIIGILLAAAAALMVIFYGGDAFNAGSIGAQANTYQNAGTNVVAAVQLAKADNFAYTDVTSLLGDYLQEAPALPAGAVSGLAADVYTATVVSSSTENADAVCARINDNLRNGLDETATAASTTAKMGCFGAGATPTFFANI
jgi:hypothetical protein